MKFYAIPFRLIFRDRTNLSFDKCKRRPDRAGVDPFKAICFWRKPSFAELGKIISDSHGDSRFYREWKTAASPIHGPAVCVPRLFHWFIRDCQYQILLNYIRIASFVHPLPSFFFRLLLIRNTTIAVGLETHAVISHRQIFGELLWSPMLIKRNERKKAYV